MKHGASLVSPAVLKYCCLSLFLIHHDTRDKLKYYLRKREESWKYPDRSVRSEQMESRTFEIVRAGLHCSLRISRQMLPLEFMFGWKTCEVSKRQHILSSQKKAHI